MGTIRVCAFETEVCNMCCDQSQSNYYSFSALLTWKMGTIKIYASKTAECTNQSQSNYIYMGCDQSNYCSVLFAARFITVQ